LQDATFFFEALSGLFCRGPKLPEGFLSATDELAIEEDRSWASERVSENSVWSPAFRRRELGTA
jgi:hypothetical protein